jgi:hypothetical protein
MRHAVETQLGHLLAEGGNGEVEMVPLFVNVLGPEPRPHVRKPSGGTARPRTVAVLNICVRTSAEPNNTKKSVSM